MVAFHCSSSSSNGVRENCAASGGLERSSSASHSSKALRRSVRTESMTGEIAYVARKGRARHLIVSYIVYKVAFAVQKDLLAHELLCAALTAQCLFKFVLPDLSCHIQVR